MRRAGSVLSIGALVMLWSGIASAHATLAPRGVESLSEELFARCFGEQAPARPDFLAADSSDESPLGDWAFRVSDDLAQAHIVTIPGFTPLPFDRLALSAGAASVVPSATPLAVPSAAYANIAVPLADAVTTLDPARRSAPAVGYYRDAAPLPTDAPASYRFDLPSANGATAFSLGPVLNPITGFTASSVGADANASVPHAQANVSLPMRVGHVRFQTHADAGQAQSDALALRDQSFGGGATFDARLGHQKLGVDVSSQLEHLQVNQPSFTASSFDGATNYALNGDHLPVFVPAYADVTKHTVSAGLAVPVSKRVTAAVQVDQQHLLGGYGAPGLSNLDANNTIYGAKVTYQFKGASALSFSAKQYHFQNNLVPSSAFTQTSANLNLTVKF